MFFSWVILVSSTVMNPNTIFFLWELSAKVWTQDTVRSQYLLVKWLTVGINLKLIVIPLSKAPKVPSTVQSRCSRNTNWLIRLFCIYHLFILLHLHLLIFGKLKFPAVFSVSQLSPTASTTCHLPGESPLIGRVSRFSKIKIYATKLNVNFR